MLTEMKELVESNEGPEVRWMARGCKHACLPLRVLPSRPVLQGWSALVGKGVNAWAKGFSTGTVHLRGRLKNHSDVSWSEQWNAGSPCGIDLTLASYTAVVLRLSR